MYNYNVSAHINCVQLEREYVSKVCAIECEYMEKYVQLECEFTYKLCSNIMWLHL